MSDLRDFGIEVVESDDGVRYQLPLRPLGHYRAACLVLILFGLIFAGFPAFFISSFVRGFAGNQGNVGIMAILTLAFEVPFLLGGLAVIAFGLVIMAGRSMIEVTSTQLISFEGVGSLGWTRRRPLERLRKLKVEGMAAKKDGKPVTEGPLAELAALRAEFKSAKPLLVAPGYPRSWLRVVAEDIARRRPDTEDVLDPEAESTKVQVVDEVGKNLDLEDYPDQPADSHVRVERQPDSVVLTIPPAGLRRGSNGLFGFAILWCGFMAVFTSIVVFFAGAGMRDGFGLFLAFIVAFWGIGIALLLAAINMGRRQAVLAVVDGTLMVYQTGLFGAKRHEWPKDSVASIRTGPSSMEVNEVPVLELQIHSNNGTKVGLLAGRNVDELRWLATMLRRSLQGPQLNEKGSRS
ncbi:MAG TPA: hypothetical protein VKE94_00960 [Gemmataceae bacterium]|nr:hypothetical protein [Gemmataceae bacterium]